MLSPFLSTSKGLLEVGGTSFESTAGLVTLFWMQAERIEPECWASVERIAAAAAR